MSASPINCCCSVGSIKMVCMDPYYIMKKGNKGSNVKTVVSHSGNSSPGSVIYIGCFQMKDPGSVTDILKHPWYLFSWICLVFPSNTLAPLSIKKSSLVDPRGGARDVPTRGPNSSILMQFSAKNRLAHPLWELTLPPPPKESATDHVTFSNAHRFSLPLFHCVMEK